MDEINFIDALPEDDMQARGRGRRRNTWYEQLRQRPGEWAEVRHYPSAQRRKAQSYAWGISHRQPDIEAVARTVGDQAIVFARAIKIPTTEE